MHITNFFYIWLFIKVTLIDLFGKGEECSELFFIFSIPSAEILSFTRDFLLLKYAPT